MEGPCAESEEKHEPASDADAAVVDSLKALDLNRPIREADIETPSPDVRFTPESRHCSARSQCPLSGLRCRRFMCFARGCSLPRFDCGEPGMG
jgi:hypothetical protein